MLNHTPSGDIIPPYNQRQLHRFNKKTAKHCSGNTVSADLEVWRHSCLNLPFNMSGKSSWQIPGNFPGTPQDIPGHFLEISWIFLAKFEDSSGTFPGHFREKSVM